MASRNPFAAIAHGHSLAEAIVDAVREPLVVLDLDLCVIAASRSFYRTFAVAPRKTEGRLLFELGDGQWNLAGKNDPIVPPANGKLLADHLLSLIHI